MAYNNIISRTDANALIPTPVSDEIIRSLTEKSAALTLFKQLRMPSSVTKLPVVSALPVAYFVSGDTGLKQTSEVNWANKDLTAEEIAVIVPIPQAVLDDASFDVWEQIKPDIEAAFARTLDAAIFFGTNKPASWPTAIVAGAVAASNVYARGTNNAAAGGIAADISNTFALVEADGFDVNGVVANKSYRGYLRNARNADGTLNGEVSPLEVYGIPVQYPMAGQFPTGLSAAELIAGDFTQGIVGLRQDITYKVFTEGVISDGSGAIQYNLMQQDMVAMRVVMRVGFQVANAVNSAQSVEADRYPFAVLRSPAS